MSTLLEHSSGCYLPQAVLSEPVDVIIKGLFLLRRAAKPPGLNRMVQGTFSTDCVDKLCTGSCAVHRGLALGRGWLCPSRSHSGKACPLPSRFCLQSLRSWECSTEAVATWETRILPAGMKARARLAGSMCAERTELAWGGPCSLLMEGLVSGPGFLVCDDLHALGRAASWWCPTPAWPSQEGDLCLS